ncbi:tRNA preQ1(34) S-adenosylmethionine ribosyltransferase-isomerase QueA [Candidatus Woesebacteria bacterium]|nr:tRNA preQ1(34) S-adenosylmethionine ribosyltransferase-isomerase QueA [Candidatus Woesebacteria bacterium]MCD8507363.1 tRNA preQ1(34) S-adenosylmethionine ribosyltransferase-isomerase QueA [Candidatus Woesebacteria bacterium]MCD8527168.1 tRNA preQ1(34) S-adenosylmethionine ribosyltransferase-isomerase QueA [Candidatus Woesebacteria bacterium]MCD8546795.1 tRNA preQ1(34) S-adenosylmethionine ribosyltransferase-isomerase QueA [Candidatus Woesebacteria bacterium]
MQLSDFHYDLPPELIAQTPVEPRDHSRLLVVDRQTKQFSHQHFYDLPTLLSSGDLLVVNNTKVLPVRLHGQKDTGGKIEVLLTKQISLESDHEVWQALTKPGLKVGQTVHFSSGKSPDQTLTLTCVEDEGYTRLVKTSLRGPELLHALDALGEIPTPPYIEAFVGDPDRYQTIFAKHAGSAAAPTAGLHFTPDVFAALAEKGIDVVEVTLHVGLGTFLPVKVDDITEHKMHSEWYEVTPKAAERINAVKSAGKRVVAVGTTSMRTLESAAFTENGVGQVRAEAKETELYVYPPYQFQVCDAMITNFHLPESTLLMLVSAFASAPQTDEPFVDFSSSLIGQAYQTAIAEKYRFFSFGDAMLIL